MSEADAKGDDTSNAQMGLTSIEEAWLGLDDTWLDARRRFCLWANRTQMRGDMGESCQHHGRMTDIEKFQRADRVFLARLRLVHGTDAPAILRRLADELEWLEQEELRRRSG